MPRLSRRGASATANLQKTTALKFRRRNSCPDGWLHAGAKVPIRLTVRQEEYCRQAISVHRFCYNLAVRTHRFCRRNWPPWPSWMDISKAFNAGKREDHPFVTQVAGVVSTGAFRDFLQVAKLAVELLEKGWRGNPKPCLTKTLNSLARTTIIENCKTPHGRRKYRQRVGSKWQQ